MENEKRLTGKKLNNILQAIESDVKHWYIPLIVGILFILFGLYVISVPVETYVTLSILFSVSFWVSGLSDIFFSLQNRNHLSGWIWYLLGGIVSLVFGIYLMVNPGISIAILPYVVGFTLLFRSAYMLGVAFDHKSYGFLNWGNVAISSALGLIVSIGLIASPMLAGFSLVFFTALAFLFTGAASAGLSFDLRRLKNTHKKMDDELKEKIRDLKIETLGQTKK